MQALIRCVLLLSFATAGLARAPVVQEEPAQASRSARNGSFIWLEEQKLVSSYSGGLAAFGWSVSLFGDTALGGSPIADVAYVFALTGTSWAEQAELRASDEVGGEEFGHAVALYGDTALVAARNDDDAGQSSGSVYAYVRTGTTWTEEAKLMAGDAAADDFFGYSLSLEGDNALIGATHQFANGTGAAYVFVRAGTTWTQETKLLASDGVDGDAFGTSVSLSGNTALVGADLDDDWGTNSGSVYVFVRTGTSWKQEAKLAAGDPGAYDAFGNAVSLSGDEAVIGAHWDTDLGLDSGSAYVFSRIGTSWSQDAKLTASNGESGDELGTSVSLAGDVVMVGAPWHEPVAGPQGGAAYVFKRSNTTWTMEAELNGSNPVPGFGFGNSVSISGDKALIGAPNDPSRVGAMYVVERVPEASALVRDGGTNPQSYLPTTLPLVGDTYSALVNLTGTSGHSHALLLGYLAPWSFTLPGGQTILVDITGGEVLHQPPRPGPLASIDINIPPDAGLAGLRVYTQVAHIGVVQPFVLSNAVDLVIGYSH